MGRNAKPLGTIMVRQAYSRMGKNYLQMTVPAKMAAIMGWEPGDELGFYPARNEAGLEGVILIRQLDVAVAAIQGFGLAEDMVPREVQAWRQPRPGSIAAREVATDDHVQDLLYRMSKGTEGRPMAESLREKEQRETAPVPTVEYDHWGNEIVSDGTGSWKAGVQAAIERGSVPFGARGAKKARPRARKKAQ